MNQPSYRARQIRQQKNRSRLRSHLTRPRLIVFRSAKNVYAQIVDTAGKVITAANETQAKATGSKTERAAAVGQLIAQKAQKEKIVSVAFDRGHYKYHGRIQALAEAARQNGLKF